MLCYEKEFLVEVSGVEQFGSAIAIYFKGQRHGFRTFRCYLLVASIMC